MYNEPHEISIKDWECFYKLCNELQGYGQDNTDKVIFRGHQDAEWDLIPSLARYIGNSQKIYDAEEELKNKFIQKWFFDEMKPYIEHTSLFPVLYIMQHYGIKTRMLDWTLSWKVAAYFATENKDGDSKDSAVWYINKTQVENQFKGICKEYEKRSQYQINKRDCELCWDQINESNCPARQSCNNQIRCNAIFFKDVLSTATDVRMMIQASCFTYCSNPLVDHIKCIAKVLGEDTKKYCKKMIIPSTLKPKFRSKLEQSEYKREKLFPEKVEEWHKVTFEEIMSKSQNK